MIDRREVIDIAGTKSLLPQVIEKDYVLGWVLAGIYQHEALAENWIFKGGTCLRKCFFETYRFSEDLDFTLREAAHLDSGFFADAFGWIEDWVYERTGIELPSNRREFDVYPNPRGHRSCQARIPYRGPIAPRGRILPNIKLDLTADEHLALAPIHTPIFHPYSDVPESGIHVTAYAYEEVFAEKIRALSERTRPRDLYDVINLYRNNEARPASAVVLDVLRRKCEYKGIPVPLSRVDIEPHRQELESGWEHMLSYQLPALPPLQDFWNTLPEFFVWLKSDVVREAPAAYEIAAGETVLRVRTLHLPVSSNAQAYLEVIRFAASNRLCVDLLYKGRPRRIEPYSLRSTKDGNVILHAYDIRKRGHRSYRVDLIQGANATGETFVPRNAVELSASGPFTIRPTGGPGAPQDALSFPMRSANHCTPRGLPYCSDRFDN